MRGKGEVEDVDWLKAQLNEAATERDKWQDNNQALDSEIHDQKKAMGDCRARYQNELQKLKDQLVNERQRNAGLTEMAVKLNETVDGSRRCEKLTAARTMNSVGELESSKMELSLLTEQSKQLEGRVIEKTRELERLISCKKIFAMSCRGCKAQVRRSFPREILEGNISETYISVRRSRTEMNRTTLSELNKSSCKCLVMYSPLMQGPH
jgi:chromosome segregation ATPase